MLITVLLTLLHDSPVYTCSSCSPPAEGLSYYSKAPGMVPQIWLNPSGHSDDSLQDPSGAELHFAVSDAEIDISEPIADALELGLPIKSVCGLPDCIVQGRCWHCASLMLSRACITLILVCRCTTESQDRAQRLEHRQQCRHQQQFWVLTTIEAPTPQFCSLTFHHPIISTLLK